MRSKLAKTLTGATKSKTIVLSVLLSVLGPVLDTFPEAKLFLADNYGPAFVVLSGVVGLLRYLTTKPLDEK